MTIATLPYAQKAYLSTTVPLNCHAKCEVQITWSSKNFTTHPPITWTVNQQMMMIHSLVQTACSLVVSASSKVKSEAYVFLMNDFERIFQCICIPSYLFTCIRINFSSSARHSLRLLYHMYGKVLAILSLSPFRLQERRKSLLSRCWISLPTSSRKAVWSSRILSQ